jgi:hypothetical protein
MKTDQLIDMLANGVTAVPSHAAAKRLRAAVLMTLPLAFLLMAGMFGMRRDLAHVATLPMFWIKVLLPASMALAAFWVAQRLARPGISAGPRWIAVAAPLLSMVVLGVAVLIAAPAGERVALVMGSTWKTCPFIITLLSVPIFAASIRSMRQLAPTRLRLAGAAAGALSSGAAAAVYALHCPEMAAPFLGIWYVLGMLLPIAIGAWLGPRLLRW